MDSPKASAARKALGFIKDGMVVGLGSGSTAALFIEMLGGKKLDVACVATSHDARAIAVRAGLCLAELDQVKGIDVAVDGADLVDPSRNLIKGMGGALAREKVVDYLAKKFVCVVDESKMKPDFRGIVPVEVIPFAASPVAREIAGEFGAKVSVRCGCGKCGPIVTDNGNWIIDAGFGKVANPGRLESGLQCIPGVVANGIFTRNRPVVVVGGKDRAKVLE